MTNALKVLERLSELQTDFNLMAAACDVWRKKAEKLEEENAKLSQIADLSEARNSRADTAIAILRAENAKLRSVVEAVMIKQKEGG